jgi:hypothetical protein
MDDLKDHAGRTIDAAQAFAAGYQAGGAQAEELTVISWALCQTEETKAANRLETRMPSEPWARSRIYGQEGNRALHLAVVEALLAEGYETVAPSLLRLGARPSPYRPVVIHVVGRHVAHVSGLGTFGLSGGASPAVDGRSVRLGGGAGGRPSHCSPLRRSFRLLPLLQRS